VRLWSIHPRYLDPRGLVALWRESLLARKVLEQATRGYRNHPQLYRFRAFPQPLKAINTYLHYVWLEADARGYKFSRSKIDERLVDTSIRIPVTSGQLAYEVNLLFYKLSQRNPQWLRRIAQLPCYSPNPLFEVVPGPIEQWEKPRNLKTRRRVRVCRD